MKRDADRRRHRALLPGVAVQVHDRGLAPQEATAGRGHNGGEAVRARDRNGFTVVVKRHLRAELRVEVEQLVRIAEIARAGILQAHGRLRVDESRIDVGAAGIDDLCACRHTDVCADRFDDAVAHHHRAAIDGWRGDWKDPRVGDGEHPSGDGRR